MESQYANLIFISQNAHHCGEKFDGVAITIDIVEISFFKPRHLVMVQIDICRHGTQFSNYRLSLMTLIRINPQVDVSDRAQARLRIQSSHRPALEQDRTHA
jgi:hypothetical protein